MYTCFRELGIYSKAKRRAFRRPKGVSNKYSNIIGGDWSTNGPFEKVCSDTTMLTHNGVKYDWNYHVDVYNNEIVGSDVANYKHCNGVMNHLRSLKDFLRIKAELKHNLKMHDFTDINTAIELYINYFNNNRPAWKLDYLTPVEYRTINGFK
jgi:transposase InsO family protein